MLELKIVFCLSAALVLYTYAGYPLVLRCGTRLKSRPIRPAGPESGPGLPSVTLLILACNEQRWIARKIQNALEMEYPPECLEIVVASDGSTDRTVEIAARYASRGVTVVEFSTRVGKQEMLNRLVPQSRGEIMVMTDANALVAADALRHLVAPFTDAQVGCAIGRRVCVVQQRSLPSRAESLYWRYESQIKQAESAWHSCLAPTGQLYAVRRNVFPHVEPVGEDFYIPMKVLASTGRRIVYVPEAVAAIPAAARLSTEFERKTRAHVALLFAFPLLKPLWIPGRSPVWWQFISHHVLRMLVPPAMIAAFVSSLALCSTGSVFQIVTLAQIAFYALALAGFLFAKLNRRPKVFYFPFYFVFVQLALAQAWLRWPFGKFEYAWQRTERFTDAN